MNELDLIYKKYSELNPFSGIGFGEDNYFKVKRGKRTNLYYYFVPNWMSSSKEDKWVIGSRLKFELNSDLTKQIYFDVFVLGYSSPDQRPKCEFCENQATFLDSYGKFKYTNYCKDHLYDHVVSLVRPQLLGRPLSEENRKNLSLAKKGKKLTEEQRLKRPRGYHFHLSNEAKQKISKSKKGKLTTWGGKYKTGIYKSNKCSEDIKYLSSFEKDFLILCDNIKDIKNIEIPDSIEYFYKGKLHNYYPDFLITTVDGFKFLVEIKAKYMVNDDLVIAKKIAGTKWSLKNKVKYVILTEEDLYIKRQKSGNILNHQFNIFNYI